MSDETSDPATIQTVVINTGDALTAVEASVTGRETVLRITPPFSGRMRARLHLASENDPTEPVYIAPETLVEPLPAYPTAADTAAELSDPTAENTAKHEAVHTDRVAAWRETVRDNLVSTAEIETASGPVAVTVRWLESDE